MPYGGYNYGGYPGPGGYYAPPAPDQLAQLRQQQFQQPMMGQQPMIQGQSVQQAQQMQQPVMTQPIAQPSGGSGIIWVSGEKEVEDYLIAPNNAVALWDRNVPTVYVKQADATGKPTTDIYDLVKRQPAQIPPPAAPQLAQSADWATKEELNALSARVDALLASTQAAPPRAKKQAKEPAEE